MATDRLRGRYTLPAERLGFLDSSPDLEVEPLGDALWTVSDGSDRTVFAEWEGGAIAWDTLSTPGRARAYREAVGREIETIVYSNDHLNRSGWSSELAPDAERWADAVAEFANGVDWPAERKPLSVSFHFRRADDEDAARAYLRRVAKAAEHAGLVPRWGRKVLEVRPPVAADKGTATRALVSRAGVDRGLYAGDDTTDIDGFRGLDGLDVAVRVAVDSGEAPPELVAAADLVVEGTEGVLALLRRL